MKSQYTIEDLSAHLFWDVDKKAIDFEKSREQIISKVIELGMLNDWNNLKEVYGLKVIKETVQQLRSIDDVTLAFLSNLFEIDKTNFRCYKLKQSNPNSWNY